jgi:hypothetical protein
MSIARLLQPEYAAEEAMSVVELAVAQLVDDNFEQDEEGRVKALLRLLFIMSESDDEHRHFVLQRAIGYAFQSTPHHARAVNDYLRELKGKGRKRKRRKQPSRPAAVAKG